MDEIEQAEFTRWYRELHPRLVATLDASCGDRALAADAADEAIARALVAWERVRQSPSPDGWVFRTAFNHLKRQGRRRKLERLVLRKEVGRAAFSPAPQPEIWDLVVKLPPRQRQAVALRHVAHLSEPAIAKVMGCRRGTVSSHLRAAYQSLRARLEEEPSTRAQGIAANVYDT